jgi:hypothetical protein
VTTRPGPTAQPALRELIDLAARTRPDLNPRQLEGLLIDHQTRGRPWPVLLVHTVRMLAQGGDIRDLAEALRDPTRPRTR